MCCLIKCNPMEQTVALSAMTAYEKAALSKKPNVELSRHISLTSKDGIV